MQRDHRLRQLSDDHHQALVLARRAMAAGDPGAATSPEELWLEVIRSFELNLAPHFEIEERLLLPALEAEGEGALAERTRSEHAQLRALVGGELNPLELRLSEFGVALRDHVRFEERVLFPAIQAKVSAEVLDAVAAACRPSQATPDGSSL